MAAGNTIGWNSIARKRSSTTSASWIPFQTENTPSTANGVSPGFAYLNRQPDADDRLTTFLLKYPVSANSVRPSIGLAATRRRWNLAHARSYLQAKLSSVFPQPYFGNARLPASQSLVPAKKKSRGASGKIPPPLHCVLLMSRSRWPPWTAGLAPALAPSLSTPPPSRS